MGKIRGTGSPASTPLSGIQPSTDSPASSGASAGGESIGPAEHTQSVSPREASLRKAEHRMGGLAQESMLREGDSAVQKGGGKQDTSPENRAGQLMQQGHYDEAARTLREHIGSSAIRAERLRPMQRQAEVLADMQHNGVQNLQNPPTQQNFRDYFGTLRGHPASEVQQRFQNYSRAFFVHSDTGPFRFGDRRMVRDWPALTSMRTPDQRYQLDCEGYAFMGRTALEAAGYENIRFGDMRPGDGSAGHMVVTGVRRQEGATEIAMISNDTFQVGSPEHGERREQARQRMLRQEFGHIIQHPYGPSDHIVQNADMAAAEAAP